MRAAATQRWRRFVGWSAGSHPVAKLFAAVLAPTVTIISTLLALGVLTPFKESDPLGASVASTLAAGTSKLRIDVGTRTDGELRTRYTAVGTYDYRENRGRFIYNYSRVPAFGHSAAVEVRFFQNVAFLHLPAPVARRQRFRRWLQIDLESDPAALQRLVAAGAATTATPAAAVDTQIADPTQILAELERRGGVAEQPAARRFGVKVREFRGTLRDARTAEDVVATAWIDDDDLVRALHLRSGAEETDMTFYDFGADVDAVPPPPLEVSRLAPRLAAEAAQGP